MTQSRFFFLFILLIGFGIFNISCTDDVGGISAKNLTSKQSKTESTKLDRKLLKILRGDFLPYKEKKLFGLVPSKYAIRKNMYLQKETIKAFQRMAISAKKEKNINLYILSATRNFRDQKYIWEAKFTGRRKVGGKKLNIAFPDERARGLEILKFSSMPGTSRHHWGSDLDIAFSIGKKDVFKSIGKMLVNKTYKSGDGLIVYNWLHRNAHRFGFCQPYQNSPLNRNPNYRRGYQEEKWHWSYTPIAKRYTQLFKKYSSQLYPRGFKGSQAGREYFLDFVLNIHPSCMKN